MARTCGGTLINSSNPRVTPKWLIYLVKWHSLKAVASWGTLCRGASFDGCLKGGLGFGMMYFKDSWLLCVSVSIATLHERGFFFFFCIELKLI